MYRCQIIGLIVAEIKETANLPKEDSEILAPDNLCPSIFGKSNRRLSNQRLGYILSLGKNKFLADLDLEFMVWLQNSLQLIKISLHFQVL